MAYRDDDESLRARLGAMEDRVRVLEDEIASLKRARVAPPGAPSLGSAPPSTRRVPVVEGGPPTTTSGVVRLVGTVAGALWFFGWAVYFVAQLFAVEDFSDFVRLALASTFIGFLPGGVAFWLAMRAPRVFYREEPLVLKMRVVGDARGELRDAARDEARDGDEDDDDAQLPSSRLAKRG